jgi:hypothetical protein
VTANSLFRDTVLNDTQLRKKMWKNLAEGKDAMVHYVIALNKWFFYDHNSYLGIVDCVKITGRSNGAVRLALNSLTDRYGLLNKSIVDNELVFTPKQNHKGTCPLAMVFNRHIVWKNRKLK